MTYAVQGNILTGACVVEAAEAAIRASSSDIPQRLMDALQAAKLGGSDGRCSCSSAAPTRCGCPPPKTPTYTCYRLVPKPIQFSMALS